MCDLEGIGVPSILRLTLIAVDLVRMYVEVTDFRFGEEGIIVCTIVFVIRDTVRGKENIHLF